MKVARSFGFIFSEKILRLAVGYFLSVFIARKVGVEGYGQFSFVIAFGALLNPLFIMGGEEHSISYLSNRDDNKGSRLGKLFGIRLMGTILGILITVLYVLSGSFSEELSKWILIYMLCFLLKPYEIIADYFLAKHEIFGVSQARNISFLLSSGLKIWALYQGLDWKAFVIISAVETLVSLFIYIIIYQWRYKNILTWFRDVFTIEGQELKEALKIMFIGFVVISIGRIEYFLVEYRLDKAAIGHFSVIAKLMEIFQIVPFTLLMVYYPVLCTKKQNRQEVELLYSMISVIILFVSLFVYFGGELFVGLIYGEKYQLVSSVIKYFWVFFAVSIVNLMRFRVFISRESINIYLIYMILYIVTSIGINLTMLNDWGIVGLAKTSLIAFVIANFIFILLSEVVRKDFFIWFRSIKMIGPNSKQFIRKLMTNND